MSGTGADVLSQFPQSPGAVGGDAFYIAFYVMVSMVVLSGIVFFLGRAFRLRSLEDWAKNEFLQVLVSAAIVGGLFFLMAPGTGLVIKAFESLKPAIDFSKFDDYAVSGVGASLLMPSCSNAGLPEGSILCSAYMYLSFLQMQILNLMAGLFAINMILDMLAKFAIDLIVIEITPLAGLTSIVQVFNNILQTLLFLGIMVQVEMSLLQFINATALNVFLPIGAVLRTFFGTRRLGGALIALAVGMYIVFPLTIALNVVAMEQMADVSFKEFRDFFNSAQSISPVGGSSGVSMTSPESWTTYLTTYADASASFSKAVASIPKIITMAVASLVVQVVFLPVLSIMLTVIAIKELANLFGSEINLGKFEV